MTYDLADVKAVTFDRCMVSDDGELLIFEVRDKRGNKGHIAVDWLKLGLTAQLLRNAAEKGAERRKSLGKSDDFVPREDLKAQLVTGFQVSEYPNEKLKVLTLQSPTGLRSDFAISTDMVDQRGRSMPRAIAEELLADQHQEKLRPN